MAETRHYPNNHPTRIGCKIVACEAYQKFLDELYRYPKEHAFSIRYGGNLYVRGGKCIYPDNPDAVRPRRLRLSRQAAKRFIAGSGEDFLNKRQRQDDYSAERARKNYEWNNVGYAVLSVHKLPVVGCKYRISSNANKGEKLNRKHCNLPDNVLSRTRNKLYSNDRNVIICFKSDSGHGKVVLQLGKLQVQILERSMTGMYNVYINIEINYQMCSDINDVENIIIWCKYEWKIQIKERYYNYNSFTVYFNNMPCYATIDSELQGSMKYEACIV